MGKNKYREFFEKDHLNEAGISFYVDDMLSGNVNNIPAALFEHVENCHKCKSEIIEVYEICNNNPEYKATLQKCANFREKSSLKIFASNFSKIAAAIILVISLTFFIKYFVSKNSLKKDLTSKNEIKDSILKKNKLFHSLSDNIRDSQKNRNNSGIEKQNYLSVNKKINLESNDITSNYEIYPDFESLIEESYRSEFSLKVIKPKTGQIIALNEPIVFKWKGENDEKIQISIFNNKAEKVYEIKSIHDNQAIINKKFRPGLYYWKVETENDLVYLGKFIIK